jgi:hypothetical protein
MDSIDWNAKAVLQQRDDAGSDMFVAFDTVAQGTVAEMAARALAMPPHDRARLVLDVSGLGMLNAGQIVALGERPDYPNP